MTTNHIDKIDSAIKRPGRINHLIHFQRSTAKNTIKQIEGYYDQSMSQEQKTGLPERKWTPAEIESICDSSQNMEQVLKKIRRR